MEIVQSRTTPPSTAITQPEAPGVQKAPLFFTAAAWNAERSCYHQLNEEVRSKHQSTCSLMTSLSSCLEAIRARLRIQQASGNSAATLPSIPASKDLAAWHLKRSSEKFLPEHSREWHFFTWRTLIELETAIGSAAAKLFMKGL